MPDPVTPAGSPDELRHRVLAARPLVVKVGSSSLTGPDGGLQPGRLSALVDALARHHRGGHPVVLVSSGAIAAGMTPLGLARRPRDLAAQQAAASVGQGALAAAYAAHFAAHGLVAGQVLLTADDVTRRGHYVNARRTLEKLLALGAVPVVNENDAVATHEIRFGDNDRLAALVAHLINAQALLLLSDVDALYDGPPSRPGSTRVPFVPRVDRLDGIEIGASSSRVGTGGMETKLEAAGIATSAGVPTLLTAAEQLQDALDGKDVGTLFAPTGRRGRARKLWLQYAASPRGRLVLDDGAVHAVVHGGKSLLPAGIRSTAGRFVAGDAVDLVDLRGTVVARGLVAYDSRDLPRLLGHSTRELTARLGAEAGRAIVHHDNLVVLAKASR